MLLELKLVWWYALMVQALTQDYCSPSNSGLSGTVQNQEFQSNGWCQTYCVSQNYEYAVVQDYNCWCANSLPGTLVDVSNCDQTCPGYGYENCGNAQNGYFGYLKVGAGKASQSSVASSSQSSTVSVESTLQLLQVSSQVPVLTVQASSSSTTSQITNGLIANQITSSSTGSSISSTSLSSSTSSTSLSSSSTASSSASPSSSTTSTSTSSTSITSSALLVSSTTSSSSSPVTSISSSQSSLRVIPVISTSSSSVTSTSASTTSSTTSSSLNTTSSTSSFSTSSSSSSSISSSSSSSVSSSNFSSSSSSSSSSSLSSRSTSSSSSTSNTTLTTVKTSLALVVSSQIYTSVIYSVKTVTSNRSSSQSIATMVISTVLSTKTAQSYVTVTPSATLLPNKQQNRSMANNGYWSSSGKVAATFVPIAVFIVILAIILYWIFVWQPRKNAKEFEENYNKAVNPFYNAEPSDYYGSHDFVQTDHSSDGNSQYREKGYSPTQSVGFETFGNILSRDNSQLFLDQRLDTSRTLGITEYQTSNVSLADDVDYSRRVLHIANNM